MAEFETTFARNEADVSSLHPGIGKFPAKPLPPLAERIADVERQILDHAVHGNTTLGIRLAVLRAERDG